MNRMAMREKYECGERGKCVSVTVRKRGTKRLNDRWKTKRPRGK